MGKVHDKSQGKLKKGMRVALITSITTLALVGAAFGGFKLYEEVSEYRQNKAKVVYVDEQHETQKEVAVASEHFEEIKAQPIQSVSKEEAKEAEETKEDERKEEEAETQEEAQQDEKAALLDDGPKVVEVKTVVEKTDVHEEVVDGEVVSTTETTTTVYQDVQNEGDQYVAVESVVKDGEGNVLSEKTIVADPQGNITEDTTLQVETQEGEVELVNGSALETAEEAEVAESENSLVQEMLEGIESTKTAEEVKSTESENSLVQEMLEGIENTKTAEETEVAESEVETAQAEEVVNPIDFNADGYKNFMFKFAAANNNTEQANVLAATVLNNLPQMPVEVQETINDPDTAITFGEIKPVGFEFGLQGTVSNQAKNLSLMPSVGMIFYNKITGDPVASVRVKTALNTGSEYQVWGGSALTGTILLGSKVSFSAGVSVSPTQSGTPEVKGGAKITVTLGGKNAKATLNEVELDFARAIEKLNDQPAPNPGPVVDNRTDEQKLFDQIVANEEANAPTVEQDMQSGHVDQDTMGNLNYGNMTYEGNTETMAEQIDNYAPIPEAPAQGDANAPGNNPLAEGNDVNLGANTNMGGLTWGD